MKKYCTLLLFFISFSICFAQNDSEKVRQLINEKKWTEAKTAALQALDVAQKSNKIAEKAEILALLGEIDQQNFQYETALGYYLEGIRLLESSAPNATLTKLYAQTTRLYQEVQVYDKAVFYANLAYQQEKNLSNTQTLALAYFQKKDYPNAQKQYEILRNEPNLDYFSQTDLLNKLSMIARTNKNYLQALDYQTQILQSNQKQNDQNSMVITLNTIGYLQKQMGDNRKAMESFRQAIDNIKQINPQNNAVLLTNLGVLYTNLGDYSLAKQYYQQAQNILNKEKQKGNQAENLNYLAFNDFLAGNNDKALNYVKEAIELASQAQAQEILQQSYKILSQIYQKMGDFDQSQEFFKKHSELVAEIEAEKNKQKQAQLQAVLNLEKKEGELKLELSDKEKQAIELQRLQLEAQKNAQEKELAQQQVSLLEKDRNLQASKLAQSNLEKQGLALQAQQQQQALLLVQQQLEAEKKAKQIEDLELQKEKQNTVLLQKELLAQQQQDSIKILETDRNFQASQLAQEQTIRQYGTAALVLLLVVIAVILYSYWQNRRKNFIIYEQNQKLLVSEEEIRQTLEEVAITNEHLKTANDEISAKNTAIVLQKEKIEKQHEGMTASINYAQKIQSAILPITDRMANILGADSFFVLFMPRDIVSGDFYFVAEENSQKVLCVGDCTGHGVPGALMSMLGLNLLEELVEFKKITMPNLILEELHNKIRQVLKQDETQNRDGMDISVVSIQNLASLENSQGSKLMYAGAMNPIYYVQNNEFVEIKGTKKVIGGRALSEGEKRIFELNEIVFKKEEQVSLYLFSDGFQDQFGGENDRKYMVRNYKKLVHEISKLPLIEQKVAFEKEIKSWIGQREQTDDITILGLSIRD